MSEPLPRSAPEAQGFPSSAVLDLINAAERRDLGLHSLMVLRRGHVVAEGWWEPYRPDRPHMLFSLSKSFTATAAGLAASEGRLSLDDSVLSFFPDQAPADPGPNLAAMRVRHLLSMSTGHAEDTTGRLRARGEREAGDWVQAFLRLPVEYAPGTRFVYNSGATYLVSAIVQRVTGQTLLQYLGPRLFDPLGIQGQTWESSPQGINVGGWGLNLKTEDIARFGQLYLQDGVWRGRRLLPEGWVAEATSAQVSNGDDPNSDWAQGYGYQFWRCRHDAYRGDGAFGQLCVVLPDQDAVVAMTAGTDDLGGVLSLIWDHLRPAMGPDALPPDPAAHESLAQRLAGLTLPAPLGAPSSPTAARVSGHTYRFTPSDPLQSEDPGVESATWEFGADGPVLTLRDRHGEHRIEAGADGWRPGLTTLGVSTFGASEAEARPVAARGAWTDPDTYALTVCYTETPFSHTLTARFTGDRVRLERRQNVSFGPTEGRPLEGQCLEREEEAGLTVYQVGGEVRLMRVPPYLYRDDLVDDETARFFERCLHQTFRVEGFDEYGQLELWATEDGQQSANALAHTIWIEPEYVEAVLEVEPLGPDST